MTFTKEQIKQVADLTGFNLAKSEKLLKGVYNDINEDGIETTFEDVLEVIDMELKSKSNFKNYVSDTTKERTKSEKKQKEDDDKIMFCGLFIKALTDNGIEVEEVKNKLNFTLNGAEFTVNITRHRPQKGV